MAAAARPVDQADGEDRESGVQLTVPRQRWTTRPVVHEVLCMTALLVVAGEQHGFSGGDALGVLDLLESEVVVGRSGAWEGFRRVSEPRPEGWSLLLRDVRVGIIAAALVVVVGVCLWYAWRSR